MPNNALTIAFTGEGVTDERFLPNIIQRTAEELLMEYGKGIIEVYPVMNLGREAHPEGDIYGAAVRAEGYHLLVVHRDADHRDEEKALKYSIRPSVEKIQLAKGDLCRTLVPIIPVRMTEAWLMADKDLLRAELRTNLSLKELGLHRSPEQYANPKQVIEQALRIAQADQSKRRRNLRIGSLYEPFSLKIPLPKLFQLPSYRAFYGRLRAKLEELQYLTAS